MKYSLNLKRLWDAASGRNGLILGGAAAATVLIVFGFLTLRELRRWQGREPPDMQVLAGKSAFAVGYDIYIQGNESNQRGELEEAARRYRESLKINPGFVPAHNNLGVALAKAGKFDDAMASFREALSVRPDYAEAHYNLGLALSIRGRSDEAIEHYRKAVSIHPGYVEAQQALRQALGQKGAR